MARPIEYNYETLKPLIDEYMKSCGVLVEEFHKTRGEKSDSYERVLKVKLPTIEGLANHLDINKTTVYEWESKYPEFSDDISKLRQSQAEELINNGLAGTYNPAITKVLLTKHGYVEKNETDLTSGGDKLNFNVINYGDNNPAS